MELEVDLNNTITEEEREEMHNELTKVLFLMFSSEIQCHAVEIHRRVNDEHYRLSGIQSQKK